MSARRLRSIGGVENLGVLPHVRRVVTNRLPASRSTGRRRDEEHLHGVRRGRFLRRPRRCRAEIDATLDLVFDDAE